MIELIRSANNARATGEAQRNLPSDPAKKWGPGARNNNLVSLGGTMRKRGMSREAIEAALLEENQLRCDPPLPEREVRSIAQSVASYRPSTAPRSTGADSNWSLAASANWPDPMAAAAYHGLVGDLVKLIEPHSEADPAALLIQTLVAFGNLIGRGPHFTAEADKHYTNLSAVAVGQTAKGRKGTSLSQVLRVLLLIDPEWNKRATTGLASGEGLIWAVRDEIMEHVPIRENGRVARYDDVVSDPGEKDKRLLVTEPEFARVLQVSERESNTLSATIRQAWDSGDLRTLTKKQSARATGAHISIIAHITKDELKRLLTDTAAANGFANRFLWVCVRRSKLLPEGGELATVDIQQITNRIRAAADFARTMGEMRRDDNARRIWHEVYPLLSDGKPGLHGAVTSRAEAQTMRLACIYAVLDRSSVISAPHLMAALEVWRYCEDSARFIFGDALGDETADELLRQLRQSPAGLTRNEIRELFQRNKSSAEIGRGLGILQGYGLARVERGRSDDAQGRPPERWVADTPHAINAVNAVMTPESTNNRVNSVNRVLESGNG
jgi:hypothetical protein